MHVSFIFLYFLFAFLLLLSCFPLISSSLLHTSAFFPRTIYHSQGRILWQWRGFWKKAKHFSDKYAPSSKDEEAAEVGKV